MTHAASWKELMKQVKGRIAFAMSVRPIEKCGPPDWAALAACTLQAQAAAAAEPAPVVQDFLWMACGEPLDPFSPPSVARADFAATAVILYLREGWAAPPEQLKAFIARREGRARQRVFGLSAQRALMDMLGQTFACLQADALLPLYPALRGRSECVLGMLRAGSV